jgi:NAD(P)H-hydrate epimerase
MTDRIPAVTPEQMAAVDRLMDEHYGVAPVQLMEVAGLAVATFSRALLPGNTAAGSRITVLAGTGGNGGDALVAARFLHGWGAAVTIVLSRHPDNYQGLTEAHLDTVGQLEIPVLAGETLTELPAAELVIDGLLGFSTTGAPRGTAANLIRLANAMDTTRLAIDVPSGLNAATGRAFDPCLQADATLTLALPKTGLVMSIAQPWTGSLFVTDIGVPAAAYQAVGVDVPATLFAWRTVLAIAPGDDG